MSEYECPRCKGTGRIVRGRPRGSHGPQAPLSPEDAHRRGLIMEAYAVHAPHEGTFVRCSRLPCRELQAKLGYPLGAANPKGEV